MKTLNFSGQSYKWPSFRIILQDDAGRMVKNVRLMKQESGTLTEYTVLPDGDWHGKQIDYSGEVSVSKHSQAPVILALASSGSWSGGSNYKGFIFGKPGAIAYFFCKGQKSWLVFTSTGTEEVDIEPNSTPIEV